MTMPSSPLLGGGTSVAELEPPDETGGLPTQRLARGRHPNVFDPKPMGASGSLQRQRGGTATNSPVEQSPEVESAGAEAVATRKRSRQLNGERERHAVNAIAFARRDEAVTQWTATGGEKASKGIRL
jgi:hypothetical protein